MLEAKIQPKSGSKFNRDRLPGSGFTWITYLEVKLLKKSSNFTSRAPNLSKFTSNGSTTSQTKKGQNPHHSTSTAPSPLRSFWRPRRRQAAPRDPNAPKTEPQDSQNEAQRLSKRSPGQPQIPKMKPKSFEKTSQTSRDRFGAAGTRKTSNL